MATNTIPIYSKAGQISWGDSVVKTANTAKDGTGTVVTIFTAGADGGRVDRIRMRPIGTNVATVLRVFINNGGANSTPANNVLYAEITLAATTGSEAAALALSEFPLAADPTSFPLVLPAGYKLNVTVGTTVASGYMVSAIGGTY